ncbi:hypothetical protein K440DRAFT_615424 [Wilcoxina mikolae CBS 423.85]|nr:hypothetical protein K440DRAFT_615424 [Wilcoxina mikolae CBS 423.85]
MTTDTYTNTTQSRCGHGHQTRDHLFKWCKKWKQQQEVFWEEVFWEEVKKKTGWQRRREVPMSAVFDSEKCIQAVLDFLEGTDMGRRVGAEEEVESSDDEE